MRIVQHGWVLVLGAVACFTANKHRPAFHWDAGDTLLDAAATEEATAPADNALDSDLAREEAPLDPGTEGASPELSLDDGWGEHAEVELSDPAADIEGPRDVNLDAESMPETKAEGVPDTESEVETAADGSQDDLGADAEVACIPSCNGMECGPDGCGGVCGTCTQPDVCVLGQCCHPDCGGKVCGPDGCGGSCGTCAGPQDACIEGKCVCQPACQGKQCEIGRAHV